MSATSEQAVWDAVETLPRAELRALQLERLRATVARVLDGQPLGTARLRDAGVSRARRRGCARRPRARCRSPSRRTCATAIRSACSRCRASSWCACTPPAASHGKPTVVGYTRADLEAWTELMARCMTMAGVRPGMVVHNANGYGLFTGGHGFHDGAASGSGRR